MLEKLTRLRYERAQMHSTYFHNQSDQILTTNIHIYKMISAFTFLGLFVFILLAHTFLKAWRMYFGYYILLILLLSHVFISFYLNKKRLKNDMFEKFILIIFSNIIFLFLICIDTVSSPHSAQMFASSFLVIAPTVFIMKPSRMICDQIYFIIFYIIMAYFFKDHAIMVTDLYGILIGLVYGCISYIITLELRMQSNSEVIKLKKSSEIDELSGIYNRRAAKSIIHQYLIARKDKDACALFMIDIDNFKTINDTFGHTKGDYVIKEVADVLRQSFRKSDIVSRFGGDEFLVFIYGVSDEKIIQKKCQLLNENVKDILGDEYTVTCSIGVYFLTQGEITFDKFVENADAALYQTKNVKKGTYTLYR